MENDPPPTEVVSKDGVTYRIWRLTEVSQILPRLEKDRAFCAYAICQLEPERFPHTRWYVAEGEGGEALVMHATGSLRGSLYGFGADLFCMGESAALDAMLSLHPGQRYLSRLWAQVEHGPVLKRHLRLVEDGPKLLIRDRSEEVGAIDPPAVRLTGADIGEINRLFRSGGGSLGLYRRELIDRGHWYGWVEDGRLVAFLSYETVSSSCGIAIHGRGLTHPEYRGRHYIRDLLATARGRDSSAKYPMRVFTVDPANAAMMRRRSRPRPGLITEDVGEVLETRAYRRDPVGLVSLIRRVLARRKARKSETSDVAAVGHRGGPD